MKQKIKKLLGKKITTKLSYLKNQYFDKYAIKIYAQDGEDIILSEFLSMKKKRFLCRYWGTPSNEIFKYLYVL